MDLQDKQEELEILFNKHQLLPVLRDQFKEVSIEYHIEEDRPFVEEALAQIYLHRQADVPTMVGILSPKFGTAQEVADKLLMIVEFDYLDYDPEKERFVVNYDISDDIVILLEKYQYPLPMIVKPNQVTKNNETGYVTIKGSVILNGSTYFKDKDVCLDHLNRANSVALALDIDVIASEQGKYIRPSRNHGEDFVDFRKRQKQADVFYATSIKVMDELTTHSDTLYLTHKYDRRGRTYSSGYHVNTQGTAYNKAVLQFANKELIEGDF